MSEQNTDQPSEAVDANAIADRIANNFNSDVPASEHGKADEGQTPGEGQPGEKVADGDEAQDKNKGAEPKKEGQEPAKQTPKEAKPAANAGDANAQTTPEDDETVRRASLGLPPKEPETVEVLKKKYSESSKEVHRIIDENKARDAYLKAAGVEFVKKADGTWTLKANDDYYKEMKDTPDIFASLSKEEKDLVDEDVAKKIVKETLARVAVARPKAEQIVQDVDVLNDSVINTTFSELVQAKMPDGQTPVFAGLEKEEIQGEIGKIFYDDAMTSFRKWASSDQNNFRLAVNLIHGIVLRREAPRMAALNAATTKDKAKTDETKNKTQVGKGSTQGQSGIQKGADVADRIADALHH